MEQVAIYIIIALVAFWLGKNFSSKKEADKPAGGKATAGKEKILEVLTLRSRPPLEGRVTNDEVEKLLGVSDATATNYLNELEEEGRVEQVGKTGRSVYYQLKRLN